MEETLSYLDLPMKEWVTGLIELVEATYTKNAVAAVKNVAVRKGFYLAMIASSEVDTVSSFIEGLNGALFPRKIIQEGLEYGLFLENELFARAMINGYAEDLRQAGKLDEAYALVQMSSLVENGADPIAVLKVQLNR